MSAASSPSSPPPEGGPGAGLLQAFEAWLSLAPGPIFPRARELYRLKYSLDGREASGSHRLFVVRESIDESCESDGEGGRIGVVTIRAIRLAVVRWQARTPLNLEEAEAYLAERWGLHDRSLQLLQEPWFRDGGPQAQFDAPLGLQHTYRAPLPATPADDTGNGAQISSG
ncbi:hypothetical protein EVJ50_00900 [Synechococcus sp. RSCCF101]|uniref:hypothetical protein n=1 Tax=Synechococcus sp. RSCCF101 TaxID=2511069 RepID=UPI00124640D1|nr:hypothetical protein [Synechococcus sp. RSCCF101]QEY31027.1 hypothetical protein EVJ50_00900 [Synechococcus sp. RSCCF101]